MPGLLSNNRDSDDDECTSSDSENGAQEDHILDHRIRLLPSPPIAIPIHQDPNVAHRDHHAREPRNVHRVPNVRLEIFNGFVRFMVPERITGMAMRRNELLYLVEWQNYGNTSYCIEARFMNAYCPNMVIEFHQKLVLHYCRYQNR